MNFAVSSNYFNYLLYLAFLPYLCISEGNKGNKLLVLAVATEENCDFKKFERAVNFHGISMKVLGMGQLWRGFGWKLSIVKRELERYRHDEHQIVLVTDSYDVLFNAGVDNILGKFEQLRARILFSAETNCWPSDHLCSMTPKVERGKRFLNAGLYIGYAAEIYEALSSFPVSDEMNDQEYFYHVYVDDEKRRKLNIKLDHTCELFQNFEGGSNDVELLIKGQRANIINRDYTSSPLIIHTPGYCKDLFSTLAAFVPKLWDSQLVDDIICIDDVKFPRNEQHPRVLVSVLADQVDEMEGFLSRILKLDYPKEKINLFIRLEDKYRKIAEDFINNHGAEYGTVTVEKSAKVNEKLSLQDMGLEAYVGGNCSHYFTANSATLLEDPNVLQLLVERNRNAISSRAFDRKSTTLRYMMFLQQSSYCKNSVKISKNMDRMLIGMF